MPRWLPRRHNAAATGPPQAAPRTPRKKRSTIAVNDLKRTHRVTWAAGDYAAVAEHIDEAPPRDLLARAELGPGLDVLDVATGTGNIALRAAAAPWWDWTSPPSCSGPRATAPSGTASPSSGSRATPSSCPSLAGSFDRVLSAFGVQVAPRHQLVADELVRVLRPGGLIRS